MLVPATAISHHRSSHHPNTQQDADAHSACKHISIIRSCRSRGIQQQKQSHHLRSQISQIWALIAAGLESKIRMHCRRLMLAECAPSQGLWMHEKLLHRTHGMAISHRCPRGSRSPPPSRVIAVSSSTSRSSLSRCSYTACPALESRMRRGSSRLQDRRSTRPSFKRSTCLSFERRTRPGPEAVAAAHRHEYP